MKQPLILTAWIISVAVIFLAWIINYRDLAAGHVVLHPAGIDTGVYAQGARGFIDGVDIYARRFTVLGDFTLPFTYPPFGALALTFMAYGPWWIVRCVVNILSVVATATTVYLIARSIPRGPSPQRARSLAIALVPVLMLIEPVRATLQYGQINALLMVLVAFDVCGKTRWLPRGVLAGIAAAVKLTPAVFGLYFLVRRDYKSLAWFISSSIASTALAWILRPDLSKEYFFHTLKDPDRIGSIGYAMNQSLRGVMARMGGDHPLLWAVVSVIVVLLAAIAIRRIDITTSNTAAMVVVTSFVALLCSPISWSHHWVWLVPLVVILLAAAITGDGTLQISLSQIVAGIAGVVVLAVSLFPTFTHLPDGDKPASAWGTVDHLTGNPYPVIALVMIVIAIIAPSVFGERVDSVHPKNPGRRPAEIL